LPKFRVVLVGAGYVSTHHLRALRAVKSAEVVGIADRDLSRAQKAAAQFEIPLACASLAELRQASPNVVHILTPPALHCPLAIEALEMGCHVFVEKPMAESAADCRRMMEVATRAGRTLGVNHSARFDPSVLKALELVRTGACGDVLGLDFLRSSDFPPYRGGPEQPPPYASGSYPFQDLGVHGLSLCETFLGRITNADIKFYGSGRDINLLFDEWRATVECERGIGGIYLSWNVRPMQNELIVHGTRGVIHVDCFLQTCTLRKVRPGPKFAGRVGDAISNSASTLCHVPINVIRFATGRLQGSPGIHVSIDRFYLALAAGSSAPVPGEEGRRVIAAMENASQAANAAWTERRRAMLAPLPEASVLVTGANGFLGRRLVKELLERGETVRVLVRRPVAETQRDSRIQVVCGDLGDPEVVEHAVTAVRTVYHVGAAMKGGAADFERGTIWGTRNIIESCVRQRVQRLVYVSSLSVLDHAGARRASPLTESAAYEPYPDKRGFYTRTKLEAEKMVLAATREQGLPAVILRPGQIFGPGAESVAPSGAISLAGRWIIPGLGLARLPLIYVDDVVSALIKAAAADVKPGSVFNLVDATPVRQRDYVRAVKRVRRQRVMYTPKWLLLAGSIACEVASEVLKRDLPLSRYRIRSLRPLSDFDVSEATNKLNWQPEVGVKAGLEGTFAGATEPAAAPRASRASA
jgi:predicted dehydrogenase/nucleoside-diphosphate-sugar epimerase